MRHNGGRREGCVGGGGEGGGEGGGGDGGGDEAQQTRDEVQQMREEARQMLEQYDNARARYRILDNVVRDKITVHEEMMRRIDHVEELANYRVDRADDLMRNVEDVAQ